MCSSYLRNGFNQRLFVGWRPFGGITSLPFSPHTSQTTLFNHQPCKVDQKYICRKVQLSWTYQWSIFCAARKLWRVQISAKEVIANSWSANLTYLYLWHLFVELVIVTPVWSGGTLYQWSLQPEKERYGQFVVKLDNSKLGSTRQWIQSKWIWWIPWSWMQSGYCHHFLLCQGTNTMRCFFAASKIFI